MPPPNLSRSNQAMFTALAAVILLGIIGLGYSLIIGGDGPEATPIADSTDWPTPRSSPTATPTNTPIPPPPPTETPTPTPAPTPIVIGWQELGTLVSVEMTMRTVVETSRKGGIGDLFTERVLLVATGNIEAGVDLTKINEEDDVVIDGTSIKIALPHAEITSVELLPGETQVYDSQGILGFPPGEGLEVEALNQARTDMESWATEEGDILNMAEKLAQTQLEAFLRKLGFEEIEITFKQSS